MLSSLDKLISILVLIRGEGANLNGIMFRQDRNTKVKVRIRGRICSKRLLCLSYIFVETHLNTSSQSTGSAIGYYMNTGKRTS